MLAINFLKASFFRLFVKREIHRAEQIVSPLHFRNELQLKNSLSHSAPTVTLPKEMKEFLSAPVLSQFNTFRTVRAVQKNASKNVSSI